MIKQPYKIVVFGKEGCQKCHTLNQRIDKMLTRDEWKDFSKAYVDVLTEQGLIEFCNTECINPQRIPAMTVQRLNKETNTYEYIPNPHHNSVDEACGSFKLYTYLGVQTDYTTTGTITPKMIKSILTSAQTN